MLMVRKTGTENHRHKMEMIYGTGFWSMNHGYKKLAIHTDSSGRLNRRVHVVGKQELCSESRSSDIVLISACLAVPSCH